MSRAFQSPHRQVQATSSSLNARPRAQRMATLALAPLEARRRHELAALRCQYVTSFWSARAPQAPSSHGHGSSVPHGRPLTLSVVKGGSCSPKQSPPDLRSAEERAKAVRVRFRSGCRSAGFARKLQREGPATLVRRARLSSRTLPPTAAGECHRSGVWQAAGRWGVLLSCPGRSVGGEGA